jgi:hypothetical protein
VVIVSVIVYTHSLDQDNEVVRTKDKAGKEEEEKGEKVQRDLSPTSDHRTIQPGGLEVNHNMVRER